MVLATEMNKHFEHLNKFVNKFSVDMDEKSKVKFRFPKSLFSFFILFNCLFFIQNPDVFKSPENKTLIKRILIKCADIANPCRPLDIYKEWTNRIAFEYYAQVN